MIVKFVRNDDFTLVLRDRGFDVSEYFFENTTLPMGYSFFMKHVHFVYHFVDNMIFLIEFTPTELSGGSTVGLLRDLGRFYKLASGVESVKIIKTLFNLHPPSKEHRSRRDLLLRFAEKLGGERVVRPGFPAGFVVFKV